MVRVHTCLHTREGSLHACAPSCGHMVYSCTHKIPRARFCVRFATLSRLLVMPELAHALTCGHEAKNMSVPYLRSCLQIS